MNASFPLLCTAIPYHSIQYIYTVRTFQSPEHHRTNPSKYLAYKGATVRMLPSIFPTSKPHNLKLKRESIPVDKLKLQTYHAIGGRSGTHSLIQSLTFPLGRS